MTPCPDPDVLRRLGADSLDAETYRRLEAHLASCPSCRDRLDRIARSEATATERADAPPAPAPTIPGLVLLREIGRGGWGVVHEAEQTTLRRRVAVKILAAAPDLDARARGLWLREARAAARVRHPNVVRLHDAGEHDGRLYLVFDLVPGGSLRDLADAPVPPAVAARIVEAIAGAVEAIHGAGLLHLDVKPANILMDGPPGAGWDALTPMLSDFGIAREASEVAGATVTLGVRGTPAYMAPEQVAGRPGTIGPAADVHALGATLYALLTGRPPFHGATPIETLDLLRDSEPPPPRALAPRIPRDLETICLKALRKAPSRRYPSARALADDLARWREGRPIQARPASWGEKAARWCRRHPAPAALAAALALTALLAVLGLTALWRRSEQQRGRAEAALARALQGETAADRLVVDLVGMLRDAVEAPERFASERSDDATHAILALTSHLRRTPELAAKHATTLAPLEMELAKFRSARVDFDGAARLLDDAVTLLAARFRASPDPDVGARMARAILHRAQSAAQRQRHEEAAADARLAARSLAALPDGPHAADEVVDLHVTRGYLAELLDGAGRADAARDLAREHAVEMDALARRFRSSPAVDLIARLARAEAAPGPPPPATGWTSEAFALFPGGEGMPPSLAGLLGDLNARELLARAVAADPTAGPGAIAAAILAEFDARCDAWDAPPRFRADLADRLGHAACVAAMDARRAGDLAGARRVVAWMARLGESLADRPGLLGCGPVLISLAREQEAKVGWAEGDLAAVDRSLRASLAEAALAFDEAPEEAAPRERIASMREKYARLAAAEPERPRPPDGP
ncbi:protein kinase [Paludisphaera sp.]|uniref:protein kinase domain-containing protein n=1 Tax=Paludisphaera sp. TaxID=2017432 RepID=UPI00301E2F51